MKFAILTRGYRCAPPTPNTLAFHLSASMDGLVHVDIIIIRTEIEREGSRDLQSCRSEFERRIRTEIEREAGGKDSHED